LFPKIHRNSRLPPRCHSDACMNIETTTENQTFLAGNASRFSTPGNVSQSPVTSSPTDSGAACRSSHGMAACS
jgi:hypothetical protein